MRQYRVKFRVEKKTESLADAFNNDVFQSGWIDLGEQDLNADTLAQNIYQGIKQFTPKVDKE